METYDAKKTTTEVRQGSRRLTNFRVLLFSGIAVIVAFIVIFVVFQLMAPGNAVT